MIVADASVVLEMLLRTPVGIRCGERLLRAEEVVCAPHLIDVEVAQVLRRFTRTGELDERRAGEALADYLGLPLVRYPHEILLPRIWELRASASAYDAAYVALAEALEAPLLTCDTHLSRARGHRARVELLR